MAKACPTCERPNNDRAARCIYCGALFPELAPEAAAPGAGTDREGAAPEAPKPRILDSFQVIVSPYQEVGDEAVVQLAKELQADLYSAKQKLKRPAPWVARAFSDAGPAQEMSGRLSALGIDSYILKQSGVEKVMEPVQVHGVMAFKEKGIVFFTDDGREVPLPYGEMFLAVRGRITERPERGEDIEEERPTVNIGKMALGSGGGEEGGEDRGVIRGYIEQIEVRPRAARMSWVLRGGYPVEIVDIYHKRSHHPVRIVESEFDFSGLGERMKPSSLQNYNQLLSIIMERAGDCPTDKSFNLVGYSLKETPNEDKVRTELEAMLSTRDADKKLYDNRAFFTEYSARLYLHSLRESKKDASDNKKTAEVSIRALEMGKREARLSPWTILLIGFLIFVRPVIMLFALLLILFQLLPDFAKEPLLLAYYLGGALPSAGITGYGISAGLKLFFAKDKAVQTAKTYLIAYLLYSIFLLAGAVILGVAPDIYQNLAFYVLLPSGFWFAVWFAYLTFSPSVKEAYGE